MTKAVPLLLIALTLPACVDGDRRARAVERGEQAMVRLQQRLLETLTTALDESGPVGAVHVCREVAENVASEVAEAEGVEIGRTSHRLRNPRNAPREWARPVVESGAGKKADEAEPHVVELDGSVGMLRPIGTLGMCTDCHGSHIDDDLKAKLAELYPEDRATGFEVGDLRGWMWAEVPLR